MRSCFPRRCGLSTVPIYGMSGRRWGTNVTGSGHMTRKKRNPDTDRVLAGPGFPDVDQLTAKTILAKKINDIVERRGLTQFDAAELLAMPQPKVSAIRNYKLRGISLERLMLALTALGQRVEITVRPSSSRAPA